VEVVDVALAAFAVAIIVLSAVLGAPDSRDGDDWLVHRR
jgi:hypothetical protein